MNSKHLLLISLITFITVLAWIVFDVYHVSKASTIKPIAQELIKPLDPNFDLSAIEKIKLEKSKNK